MSLSTAAKARLKREFTLLQKDPPPGIQAKPNANDRSDDAATMPTPTQWTHWTATIEGPRDSPFAGIDLTVQLRFPPRYPMEPPSCQFVGPNIPFHPNIDAQGRICLDTLKRPPAGSWSPAVSLASLLLSLQLLLGEPNADDGLEPDVTRLYQTSRQDWHTEARKRMLGKVAAVQQQQQQQPNKQQAPFEQHETETDTDASPRKRDNSNKKESTSTPKRLKV